MTIARVHLPHDTVHLPPEKTNHMVPFSSELRETFDGEAGPCPGYSLVAVCWAALIGPIVFSDISTEPRGKKRAIFILGVKVKEWASRYDVIRKQKI